MRPTAASFWLLRRRRTGSAAPAPRGQGGPPHILLLTQLFPAARLPVSLSFPPAQLHSRPPICCHHQWVQSASAVLLSYTYPWPFPTPPCAPPACLPPSDHAPIHPGSLRDGPDGKDALNLLAVLATAREVGEDACKHGSRPLAPSAWGLLAPLFCSVPPAPNVPALFGTQFNNGIQFNNGHFCCCCRRRISGLA